MSFENRVAVITGANGRIGRALAEQFAKEGVQLALADINFDPLTEFAEGLSSRGCVARAYKVDVTDSACVKDFAAAVLRDLGKVDILVNNAGQWPRSPFMDMDEELWLRVLDLNLNSVFRMTKAFAPAMAKQNYGRIINLGSIAGVSGLPAYSAYSSAKAAVMMLTKNLAMEFARCGITVNSVSPGMIADAVAPNSGTWVGRCGTGNEVARAIVFLADDDAGYITGEDILVDGGRVLGPHDAKF